MKKLIYGSLVCIALGLYACNSSTTDSTATDSTNTSMNTDNNSGNDSTNNMNNSLNDKDKDFVQEAGRGGKLEVALGNLATTNAGSQDIKDFGKMMVDDHSTANSELTTILKNKGITVDMEYTNDQKDILDRLTKETGKEFDMDYVNTMVSDHKEDIEAFKNASQNASDADIRNWAAKTLPVLQKHLDAIQKIKANMK